MLEGDRLVVFRALAVAWALVGLVGCSQGTGAGGATQGTNVWGTPDGAQVSSDAAADGAGGDAAVAPTDAQQTDALPTDGGGDAEFDIAGLEVAECECAAGACGVPPGCAKTCGGCGDDQICQANQCVPDPKCTCDGDSCGVKPGCSKDCGECVGNQLCESNVCTSNCSCAGIECGTPIGCALTCGSCEKGKICKDNSCIADPKCACKPGTCGQVPGCPKACPACPDGQDCVANACVASAQCSCVDKECGFPQPICAKSCGMCGMGKVCQETKCVLQKPSKRKYGEACGPSDDCPPPPPGGGQLAQNKYLICLHNQCETNLCYSAMGTPGGAGGGVCSKPCTMGADLVNNATGAPGSDNIEDPGVASDCANAADGTSGKAFRCVEQASPYQVQQGQNEPFCLPGTGFQKCGEPNSVECPAGETCRIYLIGAELTSRCGPKIHNPNGSVGAAGSMPCNENPAAGTVALCQNGFCAATGCGDLCKTDNDCKTLPGACSAGACVVNGKACLDDSECPVWKCVGVEVSAGETKTFSICQPK